MWLCTFRPHVSLSISSTPLLAYRQFAPTQHSSLKAYLFIEISLYSCTINYIYTCRHLLSILVFPLILLRWNSLQNSEVHHLTWNLKPLTFSSLIFIDRVLLRWSMGGLIFELLPSSQRYPTQVYTWIKCCNGSVPFQSCTDPPCVDC